MSFQQLADVLLAPSGKEPNLDYLAYLVDIGHEKGCHSEEDLTRRMWHHTALCFITFERQRIGHVYLHQVNPLQPPAKVLQHPEEPGAALG